MNIDMEKLNTLADELVDVLDEEMLRIELTLERLDEMRTAIIKRDDDSLGELLGIIQNEQHDNLSLDNKRRAVCVRMAHLTGVEVEQANISGMCGFLADDRRAALTEKQSQITKMAGKLKIEHTATTMLLRDCVQLNRAMLRGLFGTQSETATYNASGNSSTQAQNRGLVSMRA